MDTMIAVKSVLDTDTRWDITVMFTEDWWDSPIVDIVARLDPKVRIVRTPITNKTVCRGPWRFNKPWAGSYTAFNAWNMTEYDAVLYLDSDLVLLSNVDHLFDVMFDHPEILNLGKVSGNSQTLNTGMWMVRPDAELYQELIRFTTVNGKFKCDIGFQTAANAFLSSWIPLNRKPFLAQSQPRWFHHAPATFNCNHACIVGGQHSCLNYRDIKPVDWRMAQRDISIVHWSGDLKPTRNAFWNVAFTEPASVLVYRSNISSSYNHNCGMHSVMRKALMIWAVKRHEALQLLHTPL